MNFIARKKYIKFINNRVLVQTLLHFYSKISSALVLKRINKSVSQSKNIYTYTDERMERESERKMDRLVFSQKNN